MVASMHVYDNKFKLLRFHSNFIVDCKQCYFSNVNEYENGND